MPYIHMLSDAGMNYTLKPAIARWHVEEIVRWLSRFYPEISATNS